MLRTSLAAGAAYKEAFGGMAAKFSADGDSPESVRMTARAGRR